MFDRFLNFYSKYPWVALIIIAHWTATAIIVIFAKDSDVTTIMGITFLATIVYAYFGFKMPKD